MKTIKLATICLLMFASGPTVHCDQSAKPNLYVLAIGISDYAAGFSRLSYCASDALRFANAMMEQEGRIYQNVIVVTLTDAQATNKKILKSFNWIEEQTGVGDVAMIFFSGNATNYKGEFYYLMPYNFDTHDVRGTGLESSEIIYTIKATKGRLLLFIDACYLDLQLGTSDGEITRGLRGLPPTGNWAIFSAAQRSGSVFESQELEGGLFTRALIEGLSGAADVDNTGFIKVNTLSAYIGNRVATLTHGTQAPVIVKSDVMPDFVISAAH